ncbi:MAG: ribonuclease P protein component [Bacteroidales bacterium]
MTKNTLHKCEILRKKSDIQELWEKGAVINVYPLKLIWLENKISGHVPIKILFAVSKKKIRKAVNRNLVKRRLKELYRLHKAELVSLLKNQNKEIRIIVMYLPNTIITYNDLEISYLEIMEKLKEKLKTNLNF